MNARLRELAPGGQRGDPLNLAFTFYFMYVDVRRWAGAAVAAACTQGATTKRTRSHFRLPCLTHVSRKHRRAANMEDPLPVQRTSREKHRRAA